MISVAVERKQVSKESVKQHDLDRGGNGLAGSIMIGRIGCDDLFR
jgi:hypothetical protein